MADTDEAPEDEGDDDEGAAIEAEVEIDDPQASDRLMVDTLWSVISTRYEEPFANSGVQIAYEKMLIAAMDRIARICRNDLPRDEP